MLSSNGQNIAIVSWENELNEDVGQVYAFEYDGSSAWNHRGNSISNKIEGNHVVSRALDISGDGST